MRTIVNVNKKWAIGKDNDLLVNIPEDMKFFRKTTAGKIVIYGRRTLESFPGKKPLVGRLNIVLTSDNSRITMDSIAACDVYAPDITNEASEKKIRELTQLILDNQDAKASERPTVLVAAKTIEDVLLFCRDFPDDEAYVIGGASIYEKFLPYCNTAIVTINDCEREADTYFPNLDKNSNWEHTEVGELHEYEGVHYSFDTFRRIEVKNKTLFERLFEK